MIHIKAIRQHYSGEENVTFENIPDDLQFVKLHQYNDRQQYWMTMFLNDEDLEDKLQSLSSRSYTLGKLTLVYFSDIRFISEIPTCSLDAMKEKYKDELSNLYIKHISRDLDLLRIYKVIDFLGDKLKVSTAHFMSIIGKTEINCIDIDNIKVENLLQNPKGTAITSASHWYECLSTDNIKNEYKERVKYLASF